MITLLEGDCRKVLATLARKSVHCVVTSPPYFGLRDYGTAIWEGGDPACDHVVGEIRTGLGLAKLGEEYAGGGHKASEPKPMTAKDTCPHCGAVRFDQQIGLEASPDAFIAEMVDVFREVRRVLRDDGTCWVNLGDSYANDTKWGGSSSGKHVRELHGDTGIGRRRHSTGLKSKDLMMIPARVAIALQADGWYLRKDIIWAKPNPMPESATDRPTSSHEHVFLLAKSPRYFYDAEAVREIAVAKSLHDATGQGYSAPGQTTQKGNRVANGNSATFRGGGAYTGGQAFDNSADNERDSHGHVANETGDRNLRDVWTFDEIFPEIPPADATSRVEPVINTTRKPLPGPTSERHRSRLEGGQSLEAEPFGDRNLRDVWTIASHPFPEAHFATFPPKLVEPCIKAGTSEMGCCANCAAPWVRTITKGESDLAHQRASGGDAKGEYHGQSTKDHASAGVQDASALKSRVLAGMRQKTYGWQPTCDCPQTAPQPCTVMDPFAGAGTTGLVADRLGRSATLIELNPDYAKIARKRIERDAGLFADFAT